MSSAYHSLVNRSLNSPEISDKLYFEVGMKNSLSFENEANINPLQTTGFNSTVHKIRLRQGNKKKIFKNSLNVITNIYNQNQQKQGPSKDSTKAKQYNVLGMFE